MGANSMTGFDSKRDMAADKVQEDLINYGTAWSQDGKRIDPMSVYKEPAQEPVVQPAPGYCKNCKDYTIEEPLYAQPAQEPVAWLQIGVGPLHEGDVLARTTKPKEWNPKWWKFEPLYTTPPQREWVGLTDDEVAQAMYRTDAIFTGPMQFNFARAIEQALKEKNG